VLLQNPSILVDVLTAKPEIIYEALAKLTPWQNLATKSDLENLRRELERRMSTKEDLENLRKEIESRTGNIENRMSTKEDIKKVRENFETQLKNIEKKFETFVNGIGGRWGVKTEEVFRKGVLELLSDAGFTIKRELLYDSSGFVYDEPSDVEIDIVVKDGRTIMVEITSGLKRGDIHTFLKKKEFYEKVKNVKIDEILVITSIVDDKYPDRIIARAQSLGIRIITPGDID
ncbi:hypothetical protein DMP16_10305, partial [Sulfolobus sp. B1]